jgi:hypothetical protein
MLFDINNYCDTLAKFAEEEIGPIEAALMFLIWKQDEAALSILAAAKKTKFFKPQIFETCIKLGYIKNKEVNHTYNKLKEYYVTSKFLSKITLEPDVMFKELKNFYPETVKIETGQKIKLVNAKALSIEHGTHLYKNAIKGNRVLHFKIVEIVKEYKRLFEHAPRTLENFILKEEWDFWESQIKELGVDSYISIHNL